MVSELIDENYAEWKHDILEPLFSPMEKNQILNLPLVRSLPKDVRYWWPNSDGMYTVRSGYWLGILGRRQLQERVEGDIWRSIWNINGPPKLCHFLWRACNNSLAVNRVLYNRHIRNDCVCSICGHEDDTVYHAIFECTASHDIWASSMFLRYISDAPSLLFAELFSWMIEKLSKDEILVFATLSWAAWTSRNKVLYESSSHDQKVMASGFIRYVEEYKSYAAKVFGNSSRMNSQSANRWNPPPEGVVKLNVDAAIVEGSGSRLGVVIRNSTGRILATAVKRRNEDWKPDMAEAAALCYGIQIARRLRYMNLWFESDALGIVQKIKSGSNGLSPIFLLIDEICLAMSLFEFCFCSHVKRGGNAVTHAIARACPRNEDELVMFDSFPQSILSLAEKDLYE